MNRCLFFQKFPGGTPGPPANLGGIPYPQTPRVPVGWRPHHPCPPPFRRTQHGPVYT
ncbi:hypothetical protein J6590_026929 [Homalodisca vitripennis]|nr:hypothetical protein J6590_026929 [Homalodisca vitripennis]